MIVITLAGDRAGAISWRINSIGGFTGHGSRYSIVVLTQDNPSMAYISDGIGSSDGR